MMNKKRGVANLIGALVPVIITLIIIFIFFGPFIFNLWKFSSQTFDFGDPVIIAVVSVFVLMVFFRRVRR